VLAGGGLAGVGDADFLNREFKLCDLNFFIASAAALLVVLF
jgi:hypothetical protein